MARLRPQRKMETSDISTDYACVGITGRAVPRSFRSCRSSSFPSRRRSSGGLGLLLLSIAAEPTQALNTRGWLTSLCSLCVSGPSDDLHVARRDTEVMVTTMKAGPTICAMLI